MNIRDTEGKRREEMKIKDVLREWGIEK